MLTLPPAIRVFVSTAPVDMRHSFDRLAARVEGILQQDPFSGHLFVFRNRPGDKVKILFWDRSGFCAFGGDPSVFSARCSGRVTDANPNEGEDNMKLLTNSIREKLLRNGRIAAALAEEGKASADFIPVVKLFTPDAGCTWLLTELDAKVGGSDFPRTRFASDAPYAGFAHAAQRR